MSGRRKSKPTRADGERLRVEDPGMESVPGGKTGALANARDVDIVDQAHADKRRHDQAVEDTRGLTRATRDRDRSYPRPAGDDPNHRKTRDFPTGPLRTAPSDYLCRQLRSTSVAAQGRLRQTEYRALSNLVTGTPDHWLSLNRRLADTYASGLRLTETDRIEVQRVDRAIRRFEERNDRGHLVYTGLALDEDQIDGVDDLDTWVGKIAQPGDRFTFDQFTDADHAPHRVDEHPVLLEISTRRGMYLGEGRSDGATGHLLPRGLHLEVAAVTTTRIRHDDGSWVERPTIQLRELD